MAKVDTRTLTQAEQDQLRRRAIDAWKHGMKQAAVARKFSVREATVSAWVRAYKKKGDKAITSKPRGRPSILLTDKQKARLYKKVVGNTPGQLRLGFALWTTDAVRELIRVLFKKTVSKSTVHRLLYSWGFTPKKAQRRAWQQDQVKVMNWLNDEYPSHIPHFC